MRFPGKFFSSIDAVFLRCTAGLARPRAVRCAMWIVPVLFGLFAVALGQDANWDLRNYHWYNPYALLHGRLGIDMAPGQWQSYFNPMIDVPYYVLNTVLPAPLVGFLMGLVHGLNFLLLLAIGRCLFGQRPGGLRLALLLAAVGICGPGFLSEVGNTMGDDLTALLVLSSLYLVLRDWQGLHAWSGRTAAVLLASGLLMGLGTGLKLTNATYALALCIGLLTLPVSVPQRVAIAFVQGCGVLAGMAATAGYWWLTLWQRFGNPLFPQFNDVFRSPLAQQIGVLDSAHTPRNLGEAMLWPFVFAANIARVSEIPLKPVLLAVLYALALAFAMVWLVERIDGRRAARLDTRARFLLVFGLVAYLAWMKLFSIYRYLVPLELLAPMMVWMLLERMTAPSTAARLGGWLMAVVVVSVFPLATWGNAGWTEKSVSADVPPLSLPADTIVFTAQGDPPMGWVATFFPQQVRVIAVAGGFPESPAYLERIQAAVAARPGPHYLMLSTTMAEVETLPAGAAGQLRYCAPAEAVQHYVRGWFKHGQGADGGKGCVPASRRTYSHEVTDADRAAMQAAQTKLANYSLKVDEDDCKKYSAAIGVQHNPYRFCRVIAGG